MAAVGLGSAEVAPYLTQGVKIACENSTASITISGDLDRLEDVMASIKRERPGVLVRKLQVEMAYHSRKFGRKIEISYADKKRSHADCR